jgi:hypothetical protein
VAAYHQMGHDSWNLIPAEHLHQFEGVILSPVNSDPDQTATRLSEIGNRAALDVVLDPQFYIPRSDRGKLTAWPYFNSDCDTTDLGDSAWWAERCAQLVGSAERLGVNSICSPAILPRSYDSPYYEATIGCADQLAEAVRGKPLSVLMTAVVSFRDLLLPGAPDRIASLLTRTAISRVYLIFYDELTARQQWTDVDALVGAMSLIRALERGGTRVLVGYCGLDMMLWKYCGASAVATGKFFNLRRFGPERWLNLDVEGRVVEYWTEESLVTWLRENDVLLLRSRAPALLSADGNPFSQQIIEALVGTPRQPWLGLSWRQYLWWFAKVEREVGVKRDRALEILRGADRNWAQVEAAPLLLFDRTNDGSWIRPWLNALSGLPNAY